MAIDSMADEGISMDKISSKQHFRVDNHQNQNLTKNGTKLKKINNGIKEARKTPMKPSTLYVFFFSLFSIIFEIFN